MLEVVEEVLLNVMLSEAGPVNPKLAVLALAKVVLWSSRLDIV